MAMSPRRAEILEIAATQFALRGYGETSMRDLGEATGLLPGSIYTHFRSKAAMLVEILAQFYDELEPAIGAVVAAEGTGASKLRSILHVTVHTADRHRNALTILHYDWPQIRVTPEAVVVMGRSLAAVDAWADALRAGIADGSLRDDVPVESALRVIPPTIHALLDPNRLRNRAPDASPLSLDDVTATLDGLVVRGLLTDPETMPPLVGVAALV